MIAELPLEQNVDAGVYTPAEAAFYARVPTATVNRWLFGSQTGEAVLRPQIGAEERIVTFIDFVQILAVRAIRKDHDVPLGRIRDAVRRAEDQYSVNAPLARSHAVYLTGKDLVIALDSDLVQLSGNAAHNFVSRQLAEHSLADVRRVVEHHLRDIRFGADGLAECYRAFQWADLSVTMRPGIRFGEPVVESCGITAATLAEAYVTEGSLEAAAEAYGVRPEDVDIAYRFIDHLEGRTAA